MIQKIMDFFAKRKEKVYEYIEIENDYIWSNPWAFYIDFASLDKYLWEEYGDMFIVNFSTYLMEFSAGSMSATIYRIFVHSYVFLQDRMGRSLGIIHNRLDTPF